MFAIVSLYDARAVTRFDDTRLCVLYPRSAAAVLRHGASITVDANDPDRADAVATVSGSLQPREVGVWAITGWQWDTHLDLVSTSGGSIANSERDQIRWLYADVQAARGCVAYPSYLRRGEGVYTQPLWSGYLHNTFSAASALGLLVSLGWIPARWRQFRRGSALQRGVCPTCGYSLAGLTTPICPECGGRWASDESHPKATPRG